MEAQLADIRQSWADESKWPADPEPTATNATLVVQIRKQQAWIKGLVDAMRQIQLENVNLKKEVDELKRKSVAAQANATTLSWSKIAAGMAHKDENAVAIMATIATEMKRKEERVNNVIVAVPATSFPIAEGHELEFAKKLAGEMELRETRVKKARRISRRTDGSNAATAGPVLLVVEMESTEAKLEILQKSKDLRKKEGYKDVYVNEDLTPSERIADRKLREERNRRNNELTETALVNGRTVKCKTGQDGKKRFWGIRNGELKLVLSTVERL